MDEPPLTLDQALDQLQIECDDDGLFLLVDRADDDVLGPWRLEQQARRDRLRIAQERSEVRFDLWESPGLWARSRRRWKVHEPLVALVDAWRGVGPGALVVVTDQDCRALTVEAALDALLVTFHALGSSEQDQWSISAGAEQLGIRLPFRARDAVSASIPRFDDMVTGDAPGLEAVFHHRALFSDERWLSAAVDPLLHDSCGPFLDHLRWWRAVDLRRRPGERADTRTLLRTVTDVVVDAARAAEHVRLAREALTRELVALAADGASPELLDEAVARSAARVILRFPCQSYG